MNTSPSSARLRPFRPQPFGRYTLLSHLATGGMGEIYLARLEGAQGFEKLCVIKKILPQLAEDKEFVDRFVGEARTLVKLSHGSIAQVLDMGLHEGDAYMALEYVDGKDLRKVAGRVRDRQMPLPLTFVLFVMGRVLDALAYAHRKRDDDEKEINLVHRDISPQNILISYEGEVKVVDFGLAKSRLSAAKTNPSIILGKFLYMSPEQAKHQQVDRRSDLYAVGLCLYELIAGQNPFDSVHSGELMSAVANPRIAPLSEVEPFTPPPVSQLVMKALAVDPAQRFQTAEEFRGRLVNVLMEIDASAGPESVSRFMRDVFAAEFQSERKLLAQLKEVPRVTEPLPPRSELDTDPGARFPPPSLPAKTIKLDPPTQPLSFQPTPRNRQGVSVHEEETRPGVAISESTRPAASFEQLDATARARVRPSMSSTSPTTETVTVELRTETQERPPERPPAPPVASVAPAAMRAAALTVEVPIPYVPAAAIPPGASPPAVTAGTARTVEAPRATMPAVPSSAGPASRPVDAVRAAGPAMGAPPARPGEMPRVVPPPPLSSGPTPRSQEMMRSQAPTIQSPTVGGPELPAPPVLAAGMPPPAPAGLASSSSMPAAREPVAPPVPDSALPPPVSTEAGVPAREPYRSAPSRAAQGEPVGSRPTEPMLPQAPEGGRVEAGRHGLDDTHPGYSMPSPKPPEDTQPRVVLDNDALRAHGEAEEQIIVDGVLEEPAPPRPKPPRRGRVSSVGVPAVSRGATARGPVRPPGPEDASEKEDSGSLPIEVEEGAEVPRDPREDTRKTPIPTRPGEPSRRAQREDSRRGPAPVPAPVPVPVRKSSKAWIVVSLLMLLVAGAAVVVALPQLGHLLQQGQNPSTKLPPAVPIRPVPIPSGPPGTMPPGSTVAPPNPGHPPAPGGTAPAPGATAPAPGATAPAPGATAPAPGATAAAPGGTAPGAAPTAPAPTPAPATAVVEAAPGDDDFLVPPPNSTQAPPKKVTPSRPVKKVPRSKEATELLKDMNAIRSIYQKATHEQPCENSKLAVLCQRYKDLDAEVAGLGDEYSREVHGRVKRMRKDIQKFAP